MALITIPAPAGAAQIQALNAQAFNQLGAGLGALFGRRQQNRLLGQDVALQQAFLQEQQPGFVGPPGPPPVFRSQRGRQFQAQQAFQDPLQQALAQSQIGLNQARTIGELTPDPLSPSQQVSQEKLNRIRALRTKEESGTISKAEEGELRRLRGGGALVDINLGRPASPTERTAIAETRASIDSLDNLRTLFDSDKTRTGPIAGRIDPVKGLVGATTDEQEALMAATAAFKNKVIKDITGAQMSEVEAKRIMKQIPDITDPPARWKAKWQQTKKNLSQIQKRRLEVLEQSGVVSPGLGNQTQTQGLTPAEQTELDELLRQQ